MQILRAAEDYLEAMLMMQQKHGYIRSIDIAEQLGVTKPSVTYTTKRLRENGYITMDRDGLITLTPSGMDIAARMLDRHHTLTKFLMELGVDAKTAEEDACKMERRHQRADVFRALPPRHRQARHPRGGRCGPRRDGRDRRNLTRAAGHFRPRQPKLPRAVSFCAAGIDAAARICYAEKEKIPP